MSLKVAHLNFAESPHLKQLNLFKSEDIKETTKV